MTTALAFDVYGEPVPQGSKKAMLHRSTGRPVMFDMNAAMLRQWRALVVQAAHTKMNGKPFPIDGPVSVTVYFYLHQPKRPKWIVPAVRPDVDKLARAVLDALTEAGVFHDDAQVTSLAACKRYSTSEPFATIVVAEE